MSKKKPQHGGAREGAGRKAGITFKEATVVMRVPVSLVRDIKKLISNSLKTKRPQRQRAKLS